MPQSSYDKALLLLGQIATTRPWSIVSRGNPLLAQQSTISFAAATAGDHTIRIVDSTGNQVLSGTAAGGGTVTALIDALIAALEADPEFLNVIESATNNDPDLDLVFKHSGLTYVIDFPANPGTDMTVANGQNAGGVNIGLGLAVIQNTTDDALASPLTAAAQPILGITCRNTVVENNDGNPLSTTNFKPGDEMSIMDSGCESVQTEGAVVSGGPVFARHDVGATAFALGSLSATDDGETVAVPNARWASSTTAAGLAKVVVNLPG
jgi:hypothetical protein